VNAAASNPSDAPPRIAVIGGGITGLAAAHRITELLPHAELALFEVASRLGGVLDTVHVERFLVERSADNFLTKLPAAVELCRRLGIADQLQRTDETRRRALVVRGGRLLPIPSGFFLMSPRKLWPLLTSPVLSLRGKLRLLAEPLVRRRKPSPTGRGQAEGDESVAAFARRRLGREAFERLVQPLVAGIYTADPEKLSMAATMPEFLSYEHQHGSLLRATLTTAPLNSPSADHASGPRYALFAAPEQGMASLVSALAARLPRDTINLNARIMQLHRQVDGRWRLDFGSNPQSAIRNPQSFDAVILAVPAPAAASLLVSLDAELAAELAAIPYAGCAVVSFGFTRDQIAHPLDAFGFVVPEIERRRIIAASFASLKFPGRAPADHVLIRVFVGGALYPERVDLPDADLRQLALDELTDLLRISGEPLVADIARWPNSMPQYHVGHLDRVARIESLTARHPGLALAGNAYHGVGIPQCIASGETAAEQVAASWS